MKIFTCTDHDGHYPVGVASVVVAHDENEARTILAAALRACGLNGDQPFTLHWLPTDALCVRILNDGNY